MATQNRGRHFKWRHPLFTDLYKRKNLKGVPWRDSIYYLWYEYLKRNEPYKKYCETGKGSKDIKALYEDFGDVHSIYFQKWFRTIGQDLFCEQPDLNRIEIIEDASQLETDSPNILNLAIPINKNAEWLEKQYKKILKQRRAEKGVDLRGAVDSTARYPVELRNPNIDSLKKALIIYDAFQAKPDLSIVQVAYSTGLWDSEYSKGRTASIRNQTHRMKKMAEEIIVNVAKKQKRRDGTTALGVFPKHSVRK
jgi:hypothetical protein